MAKETDNWVCAPRINICDLAEVKFWARHFAVSETQLMQAVDKAGTGIRAVRDYFRDHAPLSRQDSNIAREVPAALFTGRQFSDSSS